MTEPLPEPTPPGLDATEEEYSEYVLARQQWRASIEPTAAIDPAIRAAAKQALLTGLKLQSNPMAPRGQFIAAAWIAGASWNQIGVQLGIRRETAVSLAMSGFLDKRLRQSLSSPGARPRLTVEMVELMYHSWLKLTRNPQARHTPADKLSKTLLIMAAKQTADDSGSTAYDSPSI